MALAVIPAVPLPTVNIDPPPGIDRVPSSPNCQTLPPTPRFIVVTVVRVPTGVGNPPATASQVIRSVEL